MKLKDAFKKYDNVNILIGNDSRPTNYWIKYFNQCDNQWLLEKTVTIIQIGIVSYEFEFNL